jgi:preprotein translocase subunit SecE
MKNFAQFLIQRLYEVKAEMAKVVWPKFHELVGSTIIVIILVTAFSLYLGSVDYILSKGAEWVFSRYGM